MCKAHVLRFSCGHGILMGIDTCTCGPCPAIKPTGARLPPQPYRCYNCQRKAASSSSSIASSRQSCGSSIGSMSDTADVKITRPPTHPLPGVARQPASTISYSKSFSCKAGAALEKPFSFACSSEHYPTPHYTSLPAFLPHQDHACPPCQLENLRVRSDADMARAAAAEYPRLTGEMMVRNGRRQDAWEGKLTLQRYVDERRQEEREMWLHVSRKWTQDLARARVLVADEDGLGLLG